MHFKMHVNRRADGRFVSPRKNAAAADDDAQLGNLVLPITASQAESLRKSAFAATNLKNLQLETRLPAGPTKAICSSFKICASTCIPILKAAYWNFFFLALICALMTIGCCFRDNAFGAGTQTLRCLFNAAACALQVKEAVWPTLQQMASAPRLSLTITESGMEGADVVFQLATPLMLESVPVALGCSCFLYLCAVLTRWLHNMIAHLKTLAIVLLAALSKDEEKPILASSLPSLL